MVCHSALMLAARITFAHFSVSSAISLPKSAGRAHKHHRAETSELRFDLRIAKARINLPIKPIDDLRWCVPGNSDAIRRARLVARHELTHARDVGQDLGGSAAGARSVRIGGWAYPASLR